MTPHAPKKNHAFTLSSTRADRAAAKALAAKNGSWWMTPELIQNRQAFQDHAVKLHPGGTRSRDVMPTFGARGAGKGF